MNIKLKKQRREEEKWKEKDSQPHFPFLKCSNLPFLNYTEILCHFLINLTFLFTLFYQVFFSVFFILPIWAWKLVVLRYPDFPEEAHTQILYTSNGWFKTKSSTVSVSKNPKMALCGLKKTFSRLQECQLWIWFKQPWQKCKIVSTWFLHNKH